MQEFTFTYLTRRKMTFLNLISIIKFDGLHLCTNDRVKYSIFQLLHNLWGYAILPPLNTSKQIFIFTQISLKTFKYSFCIPHFKTFMKKISQCTVFKMHHPQTKNIHPSSNVHAKAALQYLYQYDQLLINSNKPQHNHHHHHQHHGPSCVTD
jgi:hypothetical protein